MKPEYLLIMPIVILVFVLIYLAIKNYKEQKEFQRALNTLDGMGFLDLKERTWIFRKGEHHIGFTLINGKRKEHIYVDNGNIATLLKLVDVVLIRIVERGKYNG